MSPDSRPPLPPVPPDLWPPTPRVEWNAGLNGAVHLQLPAGSAVPLLSELVRAVINGMGGAGASAGYVHAWQGTKPDSAAFMAAYARQQAEDASRLLDLYGAVHAGGCPRDAQVPSPAALKTTATRAYRGGLRFAQTKMADHGPAYNDRLFSELVNRARYHTRSRKP